MHLIKQYIKRYVILFFIMLVVACFLIICCGEKKPKVFRVGILSGAATFTNIVDGFILKMTELGYEQGKNITYDRHNTNFDMIVYKNIIKKFVNDKVDLIFVFPTDPAVVAKEITEQSEIPIVFAMAGIEGNNLVDSVSHPGGNITGVRYPGPELTVRRLDILIELVPQAKRVYLIFDQNYPNTFNLSTNVWF